MTDVYGIQATRAVLNDNPGRARALYTQRGRRDARVNELIALARSQGVRFQAKDPAWFRQRAGDIAHQGVLLECHELEVADEATLTQRWSALGEAPLLLVLDGITDPRNLGACLRSANGAGVDVVILPKRKSAPLSAVALKTAQGGAESLLIVEVSNLARTLKALKQRGVWVVGAAGEADLLYTDLNASGPTALVMGSEGKGLRRLTAELCDQLIKIPMRGTVSSLNVSVATGILLYEIQRQRG